MLIVIICVHSDYYSEAGLKNTRFVLVGVIIKESNEKIALFVPTVSEISDASVEHFGDF
jgi:hypothetical protein